LLENPRHWSEFEQVLEELHLECKNLPAEIQNSAKEDAEWEKYSYDPAFRMYREDTIRAVENVTATMDIYIESLQRSAAAYALPIGFKVAHSRPFWRSRFNQGDVSVEELRHEYLEGNAWIIYFPYGFKGYESRTRALSRRSALNFLGMSDAYRFDKHVLDWTPDKPIALGGMYGSVDLIEVFARHLEFQLESCLSRARSRKRELYSATVELSRQIGAATEPYDDNEWFEVAMANQAELGAARIKQFRVSPSSWRCFAELD
jgi:hypothetical protein